VNNASRRNSRPLLDSPADARAAGPFRARTTRADRAASSGTAPDATETFDFAGDRVLFVASTGGHLTELHRIAPAMNAARDSTWVTFDSEQSRSLLGSTPAAFVPYIRPRDYRSTVGAIRRIREVIERERPSAVVSTGAGVAVSAFLAARRRRIPCYYVESVSRIQGPSLTGRLVAVFHLASLRTQHASWATGRWRAYPSVLSEFEVVPSTAGATPPRRPRLFVTLGTIKPYRFDALVDAILATGLADEDTVWQLGATVRDDLPGRAVSSVGAEEFEKLCMEADVVVTHAGVGTVITLLEAGIYPFVVPRRAARGEHVDDHQLEIADLLADRSLAEVHEADAIDAMSLRRAASRAVRARLDSRVA
jgi:UDP-N-acetylglucosamine--N-acetylmuramyl-(pentapeptide) pyrophosphoryl-undecaprenol N-acetylglucosamine transferase